MPYAIRMPFFSDTFSMRTMPVVPWEELLEDPDRFGLIEAASKVCAPSAHAANSGTQNSFMPSYTINLPFGSLDVQSAHENRSCAGPARRAGVRADQCRTEGAGPPYRD